MTNWTNLVIFWPTQFLSLKISGDQPYINTLLKIDHLWLILTHQSMLNVKNIAVMYQKLYFSLGWSKFWLIWSKFWPTGHIFWPIWSKLWPIDYIFYQFGQHFDHLVTFFNQIGQNFDHLVTFFSNFLTNWTNMVICWPTHFASLKISGDQPYINTLLKIGHLWLILSP